MVNQPVVYSFPETAALAAYIDDLLLHITSYPNSRSSGEAFGHQNALRTMLEGLKTFGAAHIDNINDDFAKIAKDIKVDYSCEYVLDKTWGQISEDVSIIEKIFCQRTYDPGSGVIKCLELADKVARKALQPASDKGLLEGEQPPYVITYFQKTSSVRIIPYANVALIGIPRTCLEKPKDLLAIPHEVGHYVFWNSNKVLAQYKELKKFNDYDSWLEELFADLYGCWVAGPSIAADFQDILIVQSKDEFFKTDGTHPNSVIRPLIYDQFLEKNAYFSNWAQILDDNWEEKVKKQYRNVSSLESIKIPIPSGALKYIRDIKADMSKYVTDISVYLNGTNPSSPVNWLSVLPLHNQPNAINDLYKIDSLPNDANTSVAVQIGYIPQEYDIPGAGTNEQLEYILSGHNWQTEIARSPTTSG
jgi:hypothetical protein